MLSLITLKPDKLSNGSVTLFGTDFVGPGNKLVDDNGEINFNNLPNKLI